MKIMIYIQYVLLRERWQEEEKWRLAILQADPVMKKSSTDIDLNDTFISNMDDYKQSLNHKIPVLQ